MTPIRALFIAPMLAGTLMLSACATPGPNSVSASSVQRASVVSYGTITDMRTVAIRNDSQQIASTVAGGVIGGVLGNQLGGGRGNDALTAIGAAGGAYAGNTIARNNQSYAPEWTVRLDNGRSIAVVQNSSFRIGQPVRVIYSANGEAQIAPRY